MPGYLWILRKGDEVLSIGLRENSGGGERVLSRERRRTRSTKCGGDTVLSREGKAGTPRRGAAPVVGHLLPFGWLLAILPNCKPPLSIFAIGSTNPLATVLLNPSQICAAASRRVRRLLQFIFFSGCWARPPAGGLLGPNKSFGPETGMLELELLVLVLGVTSPSPIGGALDWNAAIKGAECARCTVSRDGAGKLEEPSV